MLFGKAGYCGRLEGPDGGIGCRHVPIVMPSCSARILPGRSPGGSAAAAKASRGDHHPAQAALYRAGQNLNRGVWLLHAIPSWKLTRSAILRLRGRVM